MLIFLQLWVCAFFLYVSNMALAGVGKGRVCVCVCVLRVPRLLVETSVTWGGRILAHFPLKKTQSDRRSASLSQGLDCVRMPKKKQMQFNCVGCLVTSSQIFYLFGEVRQWH